MERIRELLITLWRELHDLPADPQLYSGRTKSGYYMVLRHGQRELRVSNCPSERSALVTLAGRVWLQAMENARRTGDSSSVTAARLTLALEG